MIRDEDEEPDPDYQSFQDKILTKIGLDLRQYKSKQMKRRIGMLITINNLKSFEELYERLEKDPKLFKRFIDRLTINVSEFFRNPEKFEEMRHKVIPTILESSPSPRIWCAGCATGEEPYSLAILFKEHFPGVRPQILATDIDQEALNKALEGKYIEKAVATMDPVCLRKYFEKENDLFTLDPQIIQMVNFKKHNLLRDSFDRNLDLIVCRNVVIYFTEDAKEKLFRNYYNSLRNNGFLFVGNTERIFNFKEIGFHVFSAFIYRKGPDPSRNP